MEELPFAPTGPMGKQPRDARSRQWGVVAALLATILLFTACLALPMLCGRIPVHGDLGLLELPMRNFYARCLKQGDAFDWTPGIFGGYFVGGEGQQGFYHPLHWLLYRWLPVPVAFTLDVFLPVIVLVTGMIVFLRRYVDLAGACMGALAATFSWMFVAHLQEPQTSGVIAQIPWVLAAIGGLVGTVPMAKKWLLCVAIALLTGSQVLLGHPQSLWFALTAESLFTLFLFLGQRATWGAWAAVVVGIALGLGMGAVQIFATPAMLTTTTRAVTDIATLASDVLEPESFFQIVAPYRTLNAYHGNYFGVVPLVLVLWWLRVSRLPAAAATTDADPRNHLFPASGNRETAVRLVSWWALLLAIVTMWLAFGLPGKLYCLQTWLPLVGKFRSPFRYLLVTQFSVAILAALAFARLVALVRSGEKVAWHDLILPWAAFAAALVVAIGDASDAGRLFYPVHPQQQFLAGPLFVGAAAGALTLAARGRGGGLVLLVLVAAIDFGLYTLGSPQGSIIWRKWEQSASSSQKLPRYEEYLARWPGPPSHKGRLYDDRFEGWIPVANHHCLNGYRVVTGYAGGLWPIQRLDYHHINSLRTAEVAWCWHPQALTASLIGLGPPLNGGWRSVPKPLPRARMVSKAVVSDVPGKDLKKIDVDSMALVSHAVALPSSAPGTADLIEDRPGKITIAVAAPQRQLLVVSESYHDGWQARVDSQPARLERVNGDFLGCVVERGKHRVELVFSPALVRTGRTVSLASFLATMIVALSAGVVRRQQQQSLPQREP